MYLQGKQVQHSPHAIPVRQGTRRRHAMANQPPQQQQQYQQQPPQQQQQPRQFQAQQSLQQQGSISRLSSDNLINSNTINMNGAALLTGLGMPPAASVLITCTTGSSIAPRHNWVVITCIQLGGSNMINSSFMHVNSKALLNGLMLPSFLMFHSVNGWHLTASSSSSNPTISIVADYGNLRTQHCVV